MTGDLQACRVRQEIRCGDEDHLSILSQVESIYRAYWLPKKWGSRVERVRFVGGVAKFDFSNLFFI